MTDSFMKWKYQVEYQNALTEAGSKKDWSPALLEYYPATRKAILRVADEEIDQKADLNAMHLEMDCIITFTRNIVRVIDTARNSTKVDIPQVQNLTEKCIPQVQYSIEQVNTHTATPLPIAIIKHFILWSRDRNSKKVKTWQSGFMEYCQVGGMATFFDEDGKLIHRKKYLKEQHPIEGELIETASLLIEISNILDDEQYIATINRAKAMEKENINKDINKKVNENVNATELKDDNPQVLHSGQYEMLYTEDKVRKSKRWKDGTLQWNGDMGSFLDEEGREIHRRRLKCAELQEGTEINACKYIFQLGLPKANESLQRPEGKSKMRNDLPKGRRMGNDLAGNLAPKRGRTTADLLSRFDKKQS